MAPKSKCFLISDGFGILIQLMLVIAAVSTLVYKRYNERPMRPWLIWGFDASKQAFAGALQHGVNMGLGLLFGSFHGVASECIWYIVNFTITALCGLFILYFVMKLYDKIVSKYNIKVLESGNYGNPPSIRPWLYQLLIWGLITCFEKIFTALVLILPLYKNLDRFAAWLESPLINYPKTELVLIMIIIPAIINSVFFWVCDNIIKKDQVVVNTTVNGYNQI